MVYNGFHVSECWCGLTVRLKLNPGYFCDKMFCYGQQWSRLERVVVWFDNVKT